ncbi:MAG: sigma-70 family RNA polymerase sigma factor [Planctomycetota bacterium]
MTHDWGSTGGLTDLEAVRVFAASRDPRAFEILIDRYQRMVLATCLRVLGDRGHAEDATQETFFKLSRHAGEITSSAGAWLHRCATRTAIDVRRSLSVRRDAEHRAAVEAARSADPAERTWKEIEPLVDAALERLRDEDRDVLVSRFLLDRTQSFMAAEAGVNAGTMSRRIDRALKRLHAELSRGGVEVAGVGVLGGAMVLAAKSAAGAIPTVETFASLGKVGLAAGASAGGTLTTKALAVSAVALIGCSVVMTGAVLMSGGGKGAPGAAGLATSPAVPMAAADEDADPLRRPGRALKGLTMVHHQIEGPMRPSLVCDGKQLELTIPHWNGNADSLTLRVLGVTPESDSAGTARVRTTKLVVNTMRQLEALRGRTFDVEYSIDRYGRLQLSAEVDVDGGSLPLAWSGVAIDGQVPDQPLKGSWAEVSAWSMNITEDVIEVMSDGHAVYRFRVLDWQERTGMSRVASICVDSMAPQLVGKRVKLLLRESDGLYELSFRQSPRERLDEWPEGFVANEKNALNVLAFRRGK